MKTNWRKITSWLLLFICIVCGLLTVMALVFTVTRFVAKNGDFSFFNIVFFSPYGIPLFLILAWFSYRAARAIDRRGQSTSRKP